MDKILYVVDDFYENPDSVREEALKKDFYIKGNYPGLRTDSVEEPEREALGLFLQNQILHQHITYWPDGYNTAFQLTTEEDETWVHHDSTTWAGIVYLTPDPSPNSGTSIYSRKSDGIYMWDGVDDSPSDFNRDWDLMQDLSQWNLEMVVENKYNRLILYKGALYHRSTTPGFGKCKETGRLFQTFFFNT